MDDTRTPSPRGGTVEPLRQPTVDKNYTPPTVDPPGRTYELYDPAKQATYRTESIDKMIERAERAGATRFVAVDTDGKRSPVDKVDGAWVRPAASMPLRLDLDEAVDLSPRARRSAREPAVEPPRSTAAASRSEPTPAPRAPEPATAPRYQPLQDPTSPERARAEAAAGRADHVARLDQGLNERYVVRRALLKLGEVQVGTTEYRFRGDTSRVAFTEGPSRLATDLNMPSVARSMVDVAEMRGWKGLRVAGNDEFRRAVWMEATVRGVRTVGYEPGRQDLEQLARAREARQQNQVARAEPAPQQDAGSNPARTAAPAAQAPAAATKGSARGSGGRKAVLAAIEAVLVDRKVPQQQREAVLAAAAEGLTRRQAAGQTHRVRVYDAQAPKQREVAAPVPTQERQRGREMAGPAPAR